MVGEKGGIVVEREGEGKQNLPTCCVRRELAKNCCCACRKITAVSHYFMTQFDLIIALTHVARFNKILMGFPTL